jgi:hypothetical protein
MIVDAIANHEAFVAPKKIDSTLGQMVSDVLYDADKFRWGRTILPDPLGDAPLLPFPRARLIHRFRRDEGDRPHQGTFRTETGKPTVPNSSIWG